MRQPILFILTMVLLSACGQAKYDPRLASDLQEPSNSRAASLAISSEPPASKASTLNSDELHGIKEKLWSNLKEFERQYSVSFIGIGIGKDNIHIMIRKSGDFEQPLTEDEVRNIKQSMFDYVGKEFPINLEIGSCCALDANITGKITQIEGNRVLVIDDHKKNGNTDDPYAVWFSLTEDGKIFQSGESTTVPFDELTVGMKVKAWFTGIMLQSYPSQTTALKVEIQ